MLGPTLHGGPPQSETAQIMLSLSGNPNGPTLQTTSRNVRISPTSRMGRPVQPTSSGIPVRNGALTSTDIKALREQLNMEPRRRGRRRQNFGFGRGRIKDLVEGKFITQNIKKEPDEVQQKDGVLLKTLESKVSLFNNNGNNDAKSPLLASLLSKAEALAKSKVKTENDAEDGPNEDQETVVFQFDGESSGASKYLDALKEAGLPTDVPVLIDNGDGNYVTLTEDVLMNVLGNNDEFQFQVTEATLEQGDVSEGVVLQDGTIMMTGKNSKLDLSGPLFTVGKKSVSVKGTREVKGKRGPRQKQNSAKNVQAKIGENSTSPRTSPQKGAKKDSPVKKPELIRDEVLESLKNGAASEAEADPDAVVLFEVTDNHKVCKYVVSSKEISALKALNEQIEKQKKLNSPSEKKDPVPTVVDGNTNIAEIKLNFTSNSRKSIVSEVLARAHSLENQVNSGVLTNLPENNDNIKNEANSPEMLDINMETDVLNDSSKLIGLSPTRDNLGNTNTLDLGEDSHILDEDNGMVVLHEGSQMMHISDGQHEGIALSANENLIVVNNNNQILHQDGGELTEAQSEDSQIMQINECSQDDGDTETTQEGIEDINDDDLNRSIESSGRDMPLLESESQLVELEFIDGNGEKIERYRVEGTVLSDKELSDLTGLSDQNKHADVIGLLDIDCEDAPGGNVDNELLTPLKQDGDNTELGNVNQGMPHTSTMTLSVTTVENTVCQSNYSMDLGRKSSSSNSNDLVLVGSIKNDNTRNFVCGDISFDANDCQELSVRQTTNSNQFVLEESMENEDTRHMGNSVLTLDENDCQELSAIQARSENLILGEHDDVNIDTRHLEPGDMSLDEGESQELSDEANRTDKFVLEETMNNEDTQHLEMSDIAVEERSCQIVSVQQSSTLEQMILEDVKRNIHSSPLESGNMSLHVGGDEELPSDASTGPEHFVMGGTVKSVHLESSDISLDGGDCQEISVEQALKAMMGDGNSIVQENQEFAEEVKQVNNIISEHENKLPLTKSTNESNSFVLVYESEENRSERENEMPSENAELILGESEGSCGPSHTIVHEENVNEGVESTIVSPTKDVPFAVGLLPLKDALVQIQSIPDYQPRKTRSSSTSKQEVVGSKRRSSMENVCDKTVKRRKSVEDDNLSSSIADREYVENTT